MNYIKSNTSWFLFLLLFVALQAIPGDAVAQKKKKKKSDEAVKVEDKKKDENKLKSIDELTKSHEVIPGLFTFYQDSASGALKMKVLADQIGKEFIHFYYVENGAIDAGAFRGNYRDSRIFKIEKYFDKIEEESSRLIRSMST